MKKIRTFALILGMSSLLIPLSFTGGECWNNPGAPMMGMPPGAEFTPGPPLGPVPLPGPDPLHCLPPMCGPPPCGPTINIEGGVRGWYTTNTLRIIRDTGPDLDFVENLRFAAGQMTGELYAALRLPPYLALTYNFRFPREEKGNGILPTSLTLGDVTFPAGDQVQVQSNTTLHRFEGELFIPIGCNFRGGLYVVGDLLVEWLKVEDVQRLSAQKTYTEFFPGVGGTAEFAPSHNFFIKGKAAYLFNQSLGGVYVDGEARFFPEFNKCGPPDTNSFRPYVGVGYRLRSTQWWREENTHKYEWVTHGPYASVGVVF